MFSIVDTLEEMTEFNFRNYYTARRLFRFRRIFLTVYNENIEIRLKKKKKSNYDKYFAC